MPNGRTMANCPATSTTVVRMKMILALLIASPPCRPQRGVARSERPAEPRRPAGTAALPRGRRLARGRDRRKRAAHVRGLDVAPLVEKDAQRVLEVADRLLGPAEHVRQPADVVQQAADGDPVGDLFVAGPGLLGVRPGQAEVSLPLRDQRRLEVDVRGRDGMLQRVRELERALDVLPRRQVVALAPVAARAPEEDLDAETVARQTR